MLESTSSARIVMTTVVSPEEAARLGRALVEERLAEDLEMPAEVITHLESLEDHSEVHHVEHYTGRPD